MLASFEPETQKSTAALVGLKAVSDPLQFFNLQSSTASVLEQRSTSSLPTGMMRAISNLIKMIYLQFMMM